MFHLVEAGRSADGAGGWAAEGYSFVKNVAGYAVQGIFSDSARCELCFVCMTHSSAGENPFLSFWTENMDSTAVRA